MSYSIYHLRFHYLPVLAKVLKGLFPSAELLGGGLSDHGFFYDFVLEGTEFDQAFLKSLEARVQELLHEGVDISLVEMMRDVAVNYLSHKKQKTKAVFLQEEYSPGIISFLKLDEYMEPVSEDIEALSSQQLKHFEFYEVKQLPDSDVTRVEGSAFFTNKELKSFRKKRKEFAGFDHLTLAREMKFFDFDSATGEGVWLPKGVDCLNLCFTYWRSFCSLHKVQEVKTGASSEEEFSCKIDHVYQVLNVNGYAAFGEIITLENDLPPESCKGMWKLNKTFTDRARAIIEWGDVQKVLISSLQSIMKTVNMLGSDCCWVLYTSTTGPFMQKQQGSRSLVELQKALKFLHIPYKTEFVEGKKEREPRAYCLIPDGLGKHWKGPFVGVSPFNKSEECQAVVCCSLFGSIERMFASILEHYKGELPLVFSPEQVRLVAMPSQSTYTSQVYQRLINEGVRVGVDQTDSRLAEKIHSAEKERIRYVAVIGEMESKKHILTLRKGLLDNKQRKVTINDLLDELHRENSEKSPFA